MNKLFSGICKKCSHRATCETPCEPVRLYVNEIGDTFEPISKDENGREIHILKPSYKQTHLSTYLTERPEHVLDELATESESPFIGVDYRNKQTGVFIDRFFRGWTYDELAEKYDCTPNVAHSHYCKAVAKLRRGIDFLDSQQRALMAAENIKTAIPKGLKWAIMHTVLGIGRRLIADLEGVRVGSVDQTIRRNLDRLAAGEIELFNFSDEEREDAKKRVKKFREYTSARQKITHSKKKKSKAA
ncbi:sigma-70 family RNA polymerase sigma factor [Desulfosarcina ovata]|uniref:Uncharacterized protein n=1 Tax=Desulfosarcina ovata subsp. ovata TaxID=2752305 RepID=A0A5K8AHU3_9BACT|nr:sigma-70 family RNA polymerase sigma factor [Desulfosarcina ovata]BBO92046.1 hypothetical protein DSCOOX_52260 [Desulfosarcina ovata subsp. ovata]